MLWDVPCTTRVRTGTSIVPLPAVAIPPLLAHEVDAAM
jgi:hypothetical protein